MYPSVLLLRKANSRCQERPQKWYKIYSVEPSPPCLTLVRINVSTEKGTCAHNLKTELMCDLAPSTC